MMPCEFASFLRSRRHFLRGDPRRWTFAANLCARQIAWAAGFSIIIAWGGAFLS